MKKKQAVTYILKLLEDWEPYIYHRAMTGSVYIKFPHWGLDSIRVSNHKGCKRYSYRWRIRIDRQNGHWRQDKYKGILYTECGASNIKKLANEFICAANIKGIRPKEKAVFDKAVFDKKNIKNKVAEMQRAGLNKRE